MFLKRTMGFSSHTKKTLVSTYYYHYGVIGRFACFGARLAYRTVYLHALLNQL